jgi:Flp pilus assembly protein TadD
MSTFQWRHLAFWRAGQLAALLAAAIGVYAGVFSAGWIWDDDDYVYANPTLDQPDAVARIWTDPAASPQYYPLVFTVLWAEKQLWGLWPPGFHALNVLLHAGSSLAIWQLVRRLGIPGGFLAGLLFALHPVHVETVAWVTELKNTLSLFFALLSLHAYLSFLDGRGGITPTSAPPPDVSAAASTAAAETARAPLSGLGPRAWYAAAVLLYAGAVFSKTVTASLPAVILVITWWRTGTLTRRDLLPVVPLVLLGLPLGLQTAWLEREQVKAVGAEFELSLPERLQLAGRNVWFYLGKLVWPANLVFIYPRWRIDGGDIPGYTWAAAAAATLGGLAWLAARPAGSLSQGRRNRGPLAAALLFGGLLFPALGFINVYPFKFSYVADHFQYHASIAPLVLAAAGIATLSRWAVAFGRAGPAAVWAVTLGMLGLLAARTAAQVPVYHDRETLWRHTIKHNPKAVIGYVNLAEALVDRGQFREVPALLTAARRLAPDDLEADLIEAAVAFREGRYADAEAINRRALARPMVNVKAVSNLAVCLSAQERWSEAAETAGLAVRLLDDADTRLTLGIALAKLGRMDEAVEQLCTARVRGPRHPLVADRLGLLLLQLGRLDEAEAALRDAHALAPSAAGPLGNLGTLELLRGRPAAAVVHLQQAVGIDPADPVLWANLARGLADSGRRDAARAAAGRAIELEPTLADRLGSLGGESPNPPP